jgi:hypothetical protein
MTNHYLVAGHSFAIEATPEQLAPLSNYAPFITDEAEGNYMFKIHVSDAPVPDAEGWEHVYTDRSDEDMPRIEMYQHAGEWLFRISMYREGDIVSAMRCSADWHEVELFILRPEYVRFAIDNAAMLVYAFSTAKLKTLLFHSSVTVLDGKGYMFLGHSGTGKSTHSKQWSEAFPESWLLNDDNPVVRMLEDGSVRVYGSPWSGKTPCYKNADAPLQALVQLAQAPHNEINRLRMTQAYPYILSSVSGLKVLPHMMDSLYESIAQLLESRPVYKLECLPNTDAARLCAQTCSL